MIAHEAYRERHGSSCVSYGGGKGKAVEREPSLEFRARQGWLPDSLLKESLG